MDRQTERETNRHTDRQRQRSRQRNRWTETDAYTNKVKESRKRDKLK